MDEIRALNVEFYKLYGELSENEEFLTRKQSDFMAQCLLKQYQIEFLKIAVAKEINDKSELFELKTKSKWYIPRRFMFFSNKLAKIIAKDIKNQAHKDFVSLKEKHLL